MKYIYSIDMSMAAGIAGFETGEHPSGWIETTIANQALLVNSSAAQEVNWRGTYVKVR